MSVINPWDVTPSIRVKSCRSDARDSEPSYAAAAGVLAGYGFADIIIAEEGSH
jgi:hypothetical protein